jgi:hypothetical protein
VRGVLPEFLGVKRAVRVADRTDLRRVDLGEHRAPAKGERNLGGEGGRDGIVGFHQHEAVAAVRLADDGPPARGRDDVEVEHVLVALIVGDGDPELDGLRAERDVGERDVLLDAVGRDGFGNRLGAKGEAGGEGEKKGGGEFHGGAGEGGGFRISTSGRRGSVCRPGCW